ncbi:TetR/AcrR family transcriptional regulator [Neobacillus sp. D3-1R]|uniref:TetR/AcrR family transcriptional regulator n=1 Tax=Neobacillus sp. D3-1R TaxID=3445778 RepID=UPI003F9EBB43
MFSKFFNLDLEKQERIINAAVKEFAQKGYVKASTNEIVKEAGISKGLLFHYFNNKQELFLFLYDYLIDLIMNDFYAKIDWTEKDLLLKLKQITMMKFELFSRFPDMFDFVRMAYEEEAYEIKKELEKRNKDAIASSYRKLFENVDASLFKEGIDVQRAIAIIMWTMEGLGNQLQEKTRILPLNQIKIDEILTEMDVYIETLKKGFYK